MARARRDADWRELKRLEDRSFTALGDNLPTSMTLGCLPKLFGYEGRLVDAFI